MPAPARRWCAVPCHLPDTCTTRRLLLRPHHALSCFILLQKVVHLCTKCRHELCRAGCCLCWCGACCCCCCQNLCTPYTDAHLYGHCLACNCDCQIQEANYIRVLVHHAAKTLDRWQFQNCLEDPSQLAGQPLPPISPICCGLLWFVVTTVRDDAPNLLKAIVHGFQLRPSSKQQQQWSSSMSMSKGQADAPL